MKIIIVLAVFMLSGCASWEKLSDPEKGTVIVSGAILVGVAVLRNSNDQVANNGCHEHANRSPQLDCP